DIAQLNTFQDVFGRERKRYLYPSICLRSPSFSSICLTSPVILSLSVIFSSRLCSLSHTLSSTHISSRSACLSLNNSSSTFFLSCCFSLSPSLSLSADGSSHPSDDKDDMGGMGSFLRDNRTLYVGGLKSVQTIQIEVRSCTSLLVWCSEPVRES